MIHLRINLKTISVNFGPDLHISYIVLPMRKIMPYNHLSIIII